MLLSATIHKKIWIFCITAESRYYKDFLPSMLTRGKIIAKMKKNPPIEIEEKCR